MQTYRGICVNALSGLYLIVTLHGAQGRCRCIGVSMPSRAYTSLLHDVESLVEAAETPRVNALSGLYLIVTKAI